jgi:hypothetical protein
MQSLRQTKSKAYTIWLNLPRRANVPKLPVPKAAKKFDASVLNETQTGHQRTIRK